MSLLQHRGPRGALAPALPFTLRIACPRAFRLLALALVALALGVDGCGREAAPAGPILLISIDTCRADRLGCYGFAGPSTPQLDRFAQEALRFTQAVTPVPLTLPAHCSMLTGLSPLQHGVHDNMGYRLDEAPRTLAEALASAGYTTAAFVSAFVLDSRFGLARGFQLYDDQLGEARGGQLNERPAGAVTDRVLQWLATAPGENWFLFVHYFDPHAPYAPPEPFAGRFPDDPYTGEIAYVDSEIGRLFARLKDLDLYDRSLIVVVGDHGEGLGDHGETGHGYFIYQSTLHVPLLIKPARHASGRAVEEPAGLIDIMPTILARAAAEAPHGLEGIDLLRASRASTEADAAPREFFCEALTATKHGCAPLLGLLRGAVKYIQASRPELYDLARDPGELADLIAERPRQALELKGALEQRLAGSGGGPAGEATGRGVSDEQVRERLQSLGYISGRAVSEEWSFDASRPDPKDRIGLHEGFEAALGLLQAQRYEEAEQHCRALIDEYGDLPVVTLLRGDIAHGAGRLTDAVTHYRRFLESADCGGPGRQGPAGGGGASRPDPDCARAHYDLANTLASLDRRDEALEHYRRAIEIQPDHREARYNRALTLAEGGHIPAAIEELRALLAMAPDFGPAYLDLAEALRVTGRPAEALELLQQAVRLLPDFAAGQVRLGDLLEASGDLARARAAYETARSLAPDSPEPLLKLARVTMLLGEREEARRLLEIARQRFPELEASPR